MDFKELDRQFDEIMEMGRPRENQPSDHFLLKKSWDYFKERIKTIESHWEEILKAKEDELKAQGEEVALLKQQLIQMEDENKQLLLFQDVVRESRREDYLNFKSYQEKLHQAFEEERIAYAEQIAGFEHELGQEKKMHAADVRKVQDQVKNLYEKIDVLKKQHFDALQHDLEIKKSYEKKMADLDSHISSWQVKNEILHNEISRRDDTIHQYEEKILELKKNQDKLDQEMKDLKGLVKDRDQKIHFLNENVRILAQEKESMRESWQREQAEWRELWDRARTVWQKNNPEL